MSQLLVSRVGRDSEAAAEEYILRVGIVLARTCRIKVAEPASLAHLLIGQHALIRHGSSFSEKRKPLQSISNVVHQTPVSSMTASQHLSSAESTSPEINNDSRSRSGWRVRGRYLILGAGCSSCCPLYCFLYSAFPLTLCPPRTRLPNFPSFHRLIRGERGSVRGARAGDTLHAYLDIAFSRTMQL